jgi:hypothetical protein
MGRSATTTMSCGAGPDDVPPAPSGLVAETEARLANMKK